MKLKSPDLAETSFTMSTIEEEIEGVNIGQGGQDNLQQGSVAGMQDLASGEEEEEKEGEGVVAEEFAGLGSPHGQEVDLVPDRVRVAA